MTTRAAILAAGASSRMGSTKALLRWDGRTLLETMVAAATRAGLPAPAVVTGGDGERVSAEARRAGALPVPNPDHRDGRFTSVRVAAAWALGASPSDASPPALLLWPVDCPGVSDATLAALRREAEAHPRSNVVPTFGGRGGHPIALCRESLEAILDAPADATLRDLLDGAPGGRRRLEVGDPAVLDNVDTPADFEAFLEARSEARARG